MIIPLSFDHLDDQVDHLQAQYSVESSEFRDTPLMNDKTFLQMQSDYQVITDVVSGMSKRKGVCKGDILALESIRSRYPGLDKFISETPLSMFSTESTVAMYDVSMENFLVSAAKAFWNMLVGLAKWIWNHLKNFWDWVTGKTVDSRKVDAKLRAFNDISVYLVQVPDTMKDIPMVAAGIRKVRDERIQDMNKVLKGYHQAFLQNPKVYSQLVETMTTCMTEGMGIVTNEIDQLVTALTNAKTEADLTTLVAKYKTLLANDTAYTVMSKSLDKLLGELPTIKSTVPAEMQMSQSGRDLLRKLNNLAINQENSEPSAMHPKVYQNLLVEGDKAVGYIPTMVTNRIDKDLKNMIQDARRFHEKLLTIKPSTPEVEKAVISSGLGSVIAQYQVRINGFQRLHAILGQILDVRNAVVDLIITTSLSEFNKVREIVDKNKDKLSIQNKVRHDGLVDRVRKSVNQSRL